MSFQAMTWAIGQQLPTRDKFVLLMLANYASNDEGECYPSINRLCSDTSMSRNTVIDAIKALEDMGALLVMRRTQNGVNLPNVYRLNLTWRGSAAVAPLVQPLTEGSAPVAPKPVIEPVNKKKEKRVRVRATFIRPNGDLQLEVEPELVESWRRAFPALNIQQQIERAELWLNANPANRKSNYERFLLNWLTRAQDNAPRVGNNGFAPPRPAAPTMRRPVHESWYSNTPQESGHVIDTVATEIHR